jgi:hypothetical protein
MEKEIDAATPPVLDRSQDPHEAPKRIGLIAVCLYLDQAVIRKRDTSTISISRRINPVSSRREHAGSSQKPKTALVGPCGTSELDTPAILKKRMYLGWASEHQVGLPKVSALDKVVSTPRP